MTPVILCQYPPRIKAIVGVGNRDWADRDGKTRAEFISPAPDEIVMKSGGIDGEGRDESENSPRLPWITGFD